MILSLRLSCTLYAVIFNLILSCTLYAMIVNLRLSCSETFIWSSENVPITCPFLMNLLYSTIDFEVPPSGILKEYKKSGTSAKLLSNVMLFY